MEGIERHKQRNQEIDISETRLLGKLDLNSARHFKLNNVEQAHNVLCDPGKSDPVPTSTSLSMYPADLVGC